MFDIGNGHYLNSKFVAMVLKSNDPATKKVRKRALKDGLLYDSTLGHKERSVIVLSTNQVVLSSLKPIRFMEMVGGGIMFEQESLMDDRDNMDVPF